MGSSVESAPQVLFWLFALAVIWTYVGYPIAITILARVLKRPVQRSPINPSISLVIPAYNEERIIRKKLDNSLTLDYPREKLEIFVISDGSTDDTNRIVAEYAGKGVKLLFQPRRRGKIAALNRAVPFTRGEIIVFSDANAMVNEAALRHLAGNFADEQVACVGGEKRVSENGSISARGESAYWRYESYLKRCDSAVGSAMGVAGELFAIRRERYRDVEEDSLIEDFVLSLRLVQAGWRVIYEPKAIAWEKPSLSLSAEWQRRTRIAAGGFQAMVRLRGMLNPLLGFPAFQYLSHRVLRWLAPFFLIAALVTNVYLSTFPLYRWTLLAQLFFYLAALTGYLLVRLGVHWRPLQMAFYFCFTNLAALAGFVRYVTRSQPVTWKKARP